jgi:hypothetical protein
LKAGGAHLPPVPPRQAKALAPFPRRLSVHRPALLRAVHIQTKAPAPLFRRLPHPPRTKWAWCTSPEKRLERLWGGGSHGCWSTDASNCADIDTIRPDMTTHTQHTIA